jgi:hypothetical protein
MPTEAIATRQNAMRSHRCLYEFERDELVRERVSMHFGDIAVTRSR